MNKNRDRCIRCSSEHPDADSLDHDRWNGMDGKSVQAGEQGSAWEGGRFRCLGNSILSPFNHLLSPNHTMMMISIMVAS